MAFTFPSLIPSLSTFFTCGSDPTLTSPTTLSLISSFCNGTNSLDSYSAINETSALTRNGTESSMSPQQRSTSLCLSTGLPSPFKVSSEELLTERELIRQAEALITLSLKDEKDHKAQSPQQLHTTESELMDDSLLEQIFEIEKLKLLLEITDHDIEQFHLQQQILNAAPSSKATTTAKVTSAQPAEIKRPDEKETFVHPGFYTLPTSSTITPLPPKYSRKRSLQEDVLEANRARAMTPTEENISRRHSAEGGTAHIYSSPVITAPSPVIPGPLMQSHPPSYSHPWLSYATPPKTPSTPSTCNYPSASTTTSTNRRFASSSPLQNNDDLPPGQPFVLAYDLSSLPFTTRSATSTSTTTPYPPPRSETSSPFAAKKRRSSKFKMDPFLLNSPSALYEGPSQQPRHPYPQHNHKREQKNPLSASSSPYLFSTKASTTHRHNPAQVPASMIPPDHFVFQEALQKQPWLRGVAGFGDVIVPPPMEARRGSTPGIGRPPSMSTTEKRRVSSSGGMPRAGSVLGQPSSSFSSSSLSLSSSPAFDKSHKTAIVIDDGEDKEARRREAAAFAASLTTFGGVSSSTLT